jgi:hypothetical protein
MRYELHSFNLFIEENRIIIKYNLMSQLYTFPGWDSIILRGAMSSLGMKGGLIENYG